MVQRIDHHSDQLLPVAHLQKILKGAPIALVRPEAEPHALGLTGRARGEDDDARLVWRGDACGRGGLERRLMRGRLRRQLGHVEDDHIRLLGTDGGDMVGGRVRVDEDELAARKLDLVEHLCLRVGLPVDGDRRRAEQHRRQPKGYVANRVAREVVRVTLARLEARLEKHGCSAQREFMELAARVRLRGQRLVDGN